MDTRAASTPDHSAASPMSPPHAVSSSEAALYLFPGGHTTEILRLVGSLSHAYSPRHYVIAESDEMSASKIHALERSRAERDSPTKVRDHSCKLQAACRG